jgi:AcrR family transcriptional regulator
MDWNWEDPKRTALLRAGVSQFARRGALAPRLHDIAREAQLSVSAVYDRFGGKEGIARALVAEGMEELDRHLARAGLGATALSARAAAIVRGTLDFAEQYPEALSMLLFHGHLLCGETHFCQRVTPRCVSELAELASDAQGRTGRESSPQSRLGVSLRPRVHRAHHRGRRSMAAGERERRNPRPMRCR